MCSHALVFLAFFFSPIWSHSKFESQAVVWLKFTAIILQPGLHSVFSGVPLPLSSLTCINMFPCTCASEAVDLKPELGIAMELCANHSNLNAHFIFFMIFLFWISSHCTISKKCCCPNEREQCWQFCCSGSWGTSNCEQVAIWQQRRRMPHC